MFFLAPWLGYSADIPAKSERPARTAETRGSSAVSAHISEAIRARLPVYQPSPPPPPTTAVAPDGTTEEIVILPPVVVNEKKVPTMGEFQMLTKPGQSAYLKKQFPGASVPVGDPLTETQPNYAALMLRDKMRHDKLRSLGETVDLFRATGDVTGSKQLKEEIQRAFIRHNDWRTEGMDRSYNNGRR